MLPIDIGTQKCTFNYRTYPLDIDVDLKSYRGKIPNLRSSFVIGLYIYTHPYKHIHNIEREVPGMFYCTYKADNNIIVN